MNKRTRLNYKLPIRDIHFNFKDSHSLQVKRWKKIFYANGNQKKAKRKSSTDGCTTQQCKPMAVSFQCMTKFATNKKKIKKKKKQYEHT